MSVQCSANLTASALYFYVCDNPSGSNVTDELWRLADRTSGLVTAIFLLTFCVLGLP